jgi:IS605 OrfB family transposase
LSAVFGSGGGTSSYAEVEDTGLIVMWGSNARFAHPIFFQHVLKGIHNGARMYAVDPRRTSTADVARVHARIADRRRDFIEQETTRIVRQSQAVSVEDLNVKGMATRHGKLGKSVHDQSLGTFVRTLEATCARYGRTFVTIDRWFPSTRLCSNPRCGRLTGPKGREQLHIRAWTCTGCGTRHVRDENAETNIRAAGRKRVAEMRREAERQNACGEHVRPRTTGQRSSKQEPTRSPTAARSGAGGNTHDHVGEDVKSAWTRVVNSGRTLSFRSEFDMRAAGTWDESAQTETTTVCAYCGVGCNLTLHVQDNEIVKVTSPHDNPVTHGNLCITGRFGYQHVQNRD